MKCRYSLFKAKSRSDDTLLTVDFNLRKLNDVRTLQSPARTIQWIDKVPSLTGLGSEHAASSIRRLKPTVNKVLSHAGHFAVDTTIVMEELMVAERFWDFLGGKGAYNELLDCFEKAGMELRPEIDNYFARYNR